MRGSSGSTSLYGTVVGLSILVMATTGCTTTEADGDSVDTTSSLADAQLIEESLDQHWNQVQAQYPSAVRPSVEVVRTISADEWAQVMADCLTEEGFSSVRANDDGSIEWGNISQVQAFDVARYVCTAKFPRDPKYQRPLTDAQLDRLYSYYVGDLTKCLTGLGYQISPPPSQQVFRETYDTDPWLPIADAASRADSPEKWAEIVRTCPQVPDDLY